MNINRLNLPQRIEVLKSMVNLPVQVRHADYSLILSADDEPSQPSDYLLDVSLGSIEKARKVDLSDIRARMKIPPYWIDVWPGEHYKLLAGLTLYLKPKRVIEIGTATGLSAITIKKYLSNDAKLYTFDIVPWHQFAETVLCSSDFEDGKMVQIIKDLIQQGVMNEYIDLFKDVDLIFMDASKDGRFEPVMMSLLQQILFKKKVILLLDDIRLWNMLAVWRNICYPKLDITSFGHWSGTGLVQLA